MIRHKTASLLDPVVDDNGAVTMQYVLGKVQKLSDFKDRICFRKDIYIF